MNPNRYKVLGLHKDKWHDTGAAIAYQNVEGLRSLIHVSEERLNREKHSRAFPDLSTNACLSHVDITVDDLDLVVLDYTINDKDWKSDFRRYSCRTDVFLKNIPEAKLKIIRHHLCHAAATFFTSPFKESAILIVDGRGSAKDEHASQFETTTLWYGNKNRIELVKESFHIGIGLLYEAVTDLIGFGFLQAGKTMGLAPFGKHSGLSLLDFKGKRTDFDVSYDHVCNIDSKFLFDVKQTFSELDKKKIAWDIQQECESTMLYIVQKAKQLVNSKNLCLGGGVALNSVANGKIKTQKIFEGLFINPACSDTGLPLGAALWGYHSELDMPRTLDEVSPFVGPVYRKDRIDRLIKEKNVQIVKSNYIEKEIVKLLMDNKALGMYQGRSEMGPRALGNRSILMSPLEESNRDYLNNTIKRREMFRPFAPIVPVQYADKYFECKDESPYMLMVHSVRSEWKNKLAAITHYDQTARIQTVTEDFNPLIYNLLMAFGDATGIPVLINTSFNLAGQPIVESPEDAYSCFLEGNLDGLFLDDRLILKIENYE